MPTQKRSALLNYAVSRLTPEVFSHPVWLRFGQRELAASISTVEDLLSSAKNLQRADPCAACQILLICAVYQNHAGQWFNALKTIQQALNLSRNNSLVKETVWALWGACAILVQQGKQEEAYTQLLDLQALLNEQNEWVLAGFVDVFRQAFSQPATKYSTSPYDKSFEETMAFASDWILHWGFSVQGVETGSDVAPLHPAGQPARHTEIMQSMISVQKLPGRWHTFMLAIRGELSLQWNKNDSPSTKRRLSFWGSILSSVRSYLNGRSIDVQAAEPVPEISNTAGPLPPKQNLPPKALIRGKKSVLAGTKTNRDHPAGKVNDLIPVEVHMLGAFSMTIGDLPVKLPSSRGLSLLKYLLFHRKRHITREAMMDIFWPDSEQTSARNSLDVALHNLRKALRSTVCFPVLLFDEGGYIFEPCLQIWLDVDEFEKCVQAGKRFETQNQRTAAIAEYETAISLYQGDFLEQNPYEEWTVLNRERLRVAYLDTLDHLSHIYFEQERYAACIAICQLILAHDRCREDTHCILMRCYSQQGQNHLALRQYHLCVEDLRAELDVGPARETTKLYQDILEQRHVQQG